MVVCLSALIEPQCWSAGAPNATDCPTGVECYCQACLAPHFGHQLPVHCVLIVMAADAFFRSADVALSESNAHSSDPQACRLGAFYQLLKQFGSGLLSVGPHSHLWNECLQMVSLIGHHAVMWSSVMLVSLTSSVPTKCCWGWLHCSVAHAGNATHALCWVSTSKCSWMLCGADRDASSSHCRCPPGHRDAASAGIASPPGPGLIRSIRHFWNPSGLPVPQASEA